MSIISTSDSSISKRSWTCTQDSCSVVSPLVHQAMAQSHDATQSEPLRSSCPFLEEEAELAPLNAAQVLKEIEELMPNCHLLWEVFEHRLKIEIRTRFKHNIWIWQKRNIMSLQFNTKGMGRGNQNMCLPTILKETPNTQMNTWDCVSFFARAHDH